MSALPVPSPAPSFLLDPSNSDELPSLQGILRLMAEHRASDTFMSVGAPIKLKIEGRQRCLSPRLLAKDDIDLLMAEYLASDKIEELEKSHELNFAISVGGVGRFRVSAFIQRNTPSVVVRYIPPQVPKFGSLRLPAVLTDLIMLKRGLVLVVGPTGCGKSTTLASLIDYRNENASDHILTIEDPIEFLHRHQRSIVNQREVGTDALSYHEALKNAMRQAPDVILIGEIRDQEAMRQAMQYAQSGHLCLATLHANNSYHALNRITGFFPPDTRDSLFPDLASSLRAIVAQRLVPSPKGERLAAVEILMNTRAVADHIKAGEIDKVADLMDRMTSDGTQTFNQVLVDMVERKEIYASTALDYADSPTEIFNLLAARGLSVNDLDARKAGVERAALRQVKSQPVPPAASHPGPVAQPPGAPSKPVGFGRFELDASAL